MSPTPAIAHLLKPHVRDLGGFQVRRTLPSAVAQTVGPFIFFDHMGPVTFAPGEGMDVRPHPHIGLATVTYLFDGEIVHRDSLGSVQAIRPGDVNWMTAGRGIVHSERTPAERRASGGPSHGIQTWVALPKAHEATEPSFSHHPAATLPQLQRPGVTMTVIAGTAFGHASPVKVFSGTLYVAIALEPGATLEIPPEHEERAVYVVSGDVALDGEAVPEAHMALLEPGQTVTLAAGSAARVMLLGGEPADGHRAIYWNFVASDRATIEDAKARWEADQFPHVPGETERIPLPPERR
jgi:redox-sensitive bicupin YhaK (pirin superfamily)